MMALTREMKNSFAAIPRSKEKKPLIGIIGEIFVRHNRFANEDIVRHVEELGGEVWLAPLEEWVYYINQMALRKAMVRLRNCSPSKKIINDIVKTMFTTYVQKGIDKKFSAPFEGFLKTVHEPSTSQLLKNAAPYLDDSFEGEAVLSMGKAVDYVKKGASGVISAMPFGCMPGTIVSALLKGLKEDWGVPTLSASFDGAEATCTGIQLETFMHQATEYTVVKKS
jgi:predicted nucleotide-binding protein (sugar kinase/HSP70/actin superfamily)